MPNMNFSMEGSEYRVITGLSRKKNSSVRSHRVQQGWKMTEASVDDDPKRTIFIVGFLLQPYLESPDIRKPHFQEKKLSVGN